MTIVGHPWRNLVFPAAYAAAISIIFFSCVPNLFDTALAPRVDFLLLGPAVFVAGAMMIYGLARGRQMEITTISFAVAALKILLIILMADAVAIALSSWWVNIGVFTRHMGFSIRLFFAFLAIYTAVFGVALWVLSYFLFNNQDDDFVAAGFPVAAGGWVSHFVLIVATLIGIHVYKVATYVPPPPPPPPPVAVQTGPPPVVPTDADQKIMERIHQGFIVIEGRHWERMHIRNDHGVAALVETLYSAGADRVFVDVESSYTDGHPSTVYVQLPDNPAQQATCKTAAEKFLGAAPPGAPGEYQKFIVMPVK